MELDELLNIDTPENVVFGYEIAGIGSRFMAAMVDTLIIVVLIVITNLVLLLFIDSEAGWVRAILGFVGFVILWGYYIYFELNWSGQSPGKRWVGLRVIRVDGTPITLSESLIRNLIRLIDFLPVSYGVGVVTMFITSQSRRLGDLAAGTIVVWEQEKVTLDSLAREARASRTRPATITADPLTDLPVERLTEADIQMAEGFLSRDRLPNRHQFAVQIEKRLYKQMDVELSPLENVIDAERRIQKIVHDYRNR